MKQMQSNYLWGERIPSIRCLIGWSQRGLAIVLFCAGVLLSSSTAWAQPLAKATFAGGCFWCMEKPFDQLPGVQDTTVGYTGGRVPNPTYRQVSAGNTGHAESVQITYDPEQVSYETLLQVFWHNVDPLDAAGQFCDRGTQYRASIFYHNDAQRQAALASKAALEKQFSQQTFYTAENYHQNYYQTHPVRYRLYRFGCGRDQRLAERWGEPQTPYR